MALVVLRIFNFFPNNFVRLYYDSCHISMDFKKNITIGTFLSSHFNIEDGRKYTFSVSHIALKNKKHTIVRFFISRKEKTTGTQKKICAMYGEGAVTERLCQKWLVKFLGTIDILTKSFFAVGLSCALEGV